LEKEFLETKNSLAESESKYQADLKGLQERHDKEKQEMQAKIFKALEEVKDLNSQITKMQAKGTHSTLNTSSFDNNNNLCKICKSS
jgi:hypothetical protein